jgi:protein pelota
MLDKCILSSLRSRPLLNFYSFRFFKMLGTDEQRAWYGPTHVSLAANRGAVGTLLISDELFRASDPAQRKIYVELVETVKGNGAEVLIFSSMHESGQRE